MESNAVIDSINLVKSELCGSQECNSPLEWRRRTASSGLPGLDLPHRVGGKQWSARQMAYIFALLGRIDLDLRDVPGGGHSRILLASKQRKYDWILSNVSKAQEFFAVTITEPNAGSDINNIQTIATPVSEGYQITGRKLYVARILEASHLIVFAKVDRSELEKPITVFILSRDTPNIRFEELKGMGLNGTSFGGLHLDKVFVPNSMRVGGEGQGFSLFTEHFTYWRSAMAAAAIGCAQGALEKAIKHLQNREAFGGPIGRFTHLQQEFAEHLSKIHMVWLLILSVMERIDNRLPAYVDAAMAKAEAVETALRAVEWSMKVFGARGYIDQIDLEKRFRDLLGLRIADGTTDVLRGQVARAVLGDGLYDLSLGRKHNIDELKTDVTRRFW